MDTARRALRDTTDRAHQRLDRHSLILPLVEGRIDRSGYKTLLECLYGFHAPLEQAIRIGAAALPYNVEIEKRIRVVMLRRDLLDLGLDEFAIDRLPLAQAPRLDTPGRVLGALYVREGSTLGGRVLAKRLDAVLGVGAAEGRQFLSGGPDNALMWQSCCAVLETASNDGHLADIVQSAEETFDWIEMWLNTAADSQGRKE